MSSIPPTVGRIVHYHENAAKPNEPRAALVVRTWGAPGETFPTINLAVFDHDGSAMPRTSVLHASKAGENAGWDWPPRGATV